MNILVFLYVGEYNSHGSLEITKLNTIVAQFFYKFNIPTTTLRTYRSNSLKQIRTHRYCKLGRW